MVCKTWKQRSLGLQLPDLPWHLIPHRQWSSAMDMTNYFLEMVTKPCDFQSSHDLLCFQLSQNCSNCLWVKKEKQKGNSTFSMRHLTSGWSWIQAAAVKIQCVCSQPLSHINGNYLPAWGSVCPVLMEVKSDSSSKHGHRVHRANIYYKLEFLVVVFMK